MPTFMIMKALQHQCDSVSQCVDTAPEDNATSGNYDLDHDVNIGDNNNGNNDDDANG